MGCIKFIIDECAQPSIPGKAWPGGARGLELADVQREAYRDYLARSDVAAELSKLKALKGDE